MSGQLQTGVMRIGYRTAGGVEILRGQVVAVAQLELSGLVTLQVPITGEEVCFTAREVDMTPLQPKRSSEACKPASLGTVAQAKGTA